MMSVSQSRRLFAVTMASALIVAALSIPAAATLPGRLLAPAPLGTVDTLAGPAFCGRGTAEPDPASAEVGDVATDASGTLWFESGVTGQVTKAASSNSIEVVPAAVERRHPGEKAPPRKPPSRLVADGAGGLIVAAPTAIVGFAPSRGTVAGTMAPDRDAAGDRETLRGDGGPMAAARFTRVAAIAGDRSGNIFVAEDIEPRTSAIAIRFLNRSEAPVTFFAGTPHELTVAPGAIDTIAGGKRPTGRLVAAAPALAMGADRLYIGAALAGARPRGVVRVINLGGESKKMNGKTVAPGAAVELATLGGRSGSGLAGGGGALPALSGIAADEAGNVFLAEPANHRVRRISPAGAVTTVAGTGVPGFSGNDKPAVDSRLSRPYDVEVGTQGRIYIADSGNNLVRFVDSKGLLHVALGNGATSMWICSSSDGQSPPSPARPRSVAVSGGNVFVVSTSLNQVLRLSPSGKLQAVAGRPLSSCDGRDACAAEDTTSPLEAGLGAIGAVATGPRGSLYVVDSHRVRLLNLARRTITAHGVVVPAGAMRTVAGPPPFSGGPQGAASAPGSPSLADRPQPTPDGGPAVGPATGAALTAAAGDGKGNLAVGERLGGFSLGRSSVRLVDAKGVITTIVPGLGPRPDGSIDRTRCCNLVAGLRFDDGGNLYIADGERRVWFLNRSTAPAVVHGVRVAPASIEPVAGAVARGRQDERIPALAAQLISPYGLALGPAGSLYVVDTSEHSVHRVDGRGIITTVLGTGQHGFNGDGLRGQLTSLDEPVEVAIDQCGNLLVTDLANDRLRRLNLTTCRSAAPAATSSEASPSPARLGMAVAVASGTAAVAVVLRRRRRCRANAHPV